MLQKTLLAFVLLLCFASQSQAQDLPNAGFDTTAYHPVFIQSSDGLFKLNIGLYTQFRYNQNWRQDVPDTEEAYSKGYNSARTRLFLEGDVTDKLYFHFRVNVNPTGDFELMAAYLQWKLNDKMKIRMGRQFMALGREDWMYPQDLASMEFSAQDFTYAIWSSFGFQFNHAVSDKFRYWVSVGNGAYGGRRTFPAPKSSDFALTGRVEWNILGSNWDIWGDMLGRKGSEFGMLLGGGAAYITRSNQEDLLTDAKNGYQLNVDYSVSGDGYHLFTHYTNTSRTYDGSDESISGSSFYGTFGYWLNDKVFPYLRYDMVAKGNLPGVTETYSSPGIGVSYYPFNWSNRYKFTLEYNHLAATVDNTFVEADGQLGLVPSTFGAQQSLRFQIQFGF
ncbi:MAG: OprO/OprP family phosphate-selective porin [Reichenbachiella sp.]